MVTSPRRRRRAAYELEGGRATAMPIDCPAQREDVPHEAHPSSFEMISLPGITLKRFGLFCNSNLIISLELT